MKEVSLQVEINTRKIMLSSKSLFFKTEYFMKQTKYFTNLDRLLSKMCETILSRLNDITYGEKQVRDGLECFSIRTTDGQFRFLFKLGYQLGSMANPYDIIFFDCGQFNQGQVHTISEYVELSPVISAVIRKEKQFVKSQDFNRLYQISSVSNVNLPKLSTEQKEIVETVDKNVLVQGVAGSGKTNICIDKIIFTACKNYSGKVLYSTYSRGLLNDTKLKVEAYKKDLQEIIDGFKNGNIVFLDDDHKHALSNRLGIYFFSDDNDQLLEKVEKVLDYLTNKVEYLLIEDIYKNHFGDSAEFVGENYFINTYSKKLANYQIEKCFNRLASYSKEIIYKEIFGAVFGCYDLTKRYDILPLEDYILSKTDSFSKQECEYIYQIALDYKKTLDRCNLIDNNIASKKLILKISAPQYSLAVIDEVQDYTQANLCLFKKLSLKMFCVGDALQMINPSYFNFGYLKNLLFEKDVTDVKELKNNYRNTSKIVEMIDALGEINKAEFGTHNFVLKGQSVESGLKTTAVFVKDREFVNRVAKSGFDNFTFVVSSQKAKQDLRQVIKNQEVLTVSEIKGLERNTVVVVNLISDNSDKWRQLENKRLNHKVADENSVFRYYYNLFYVGLSRAKQNIFVLETIGAKQFADFFKTNFLCCDTGSAIKKLEELVSKVEFTQAEVFERVDEFVKLGQFDNARFIAEKILDNQKRIESLRIIDVYDEYVSKGKYRDAGIKFWEYGLISEAKKQFILSGDTMLIELINACSKRNSTNLNIDIIDYYDDVRNNEVARNFILEVAKKDVEMLKRSFATSKNEFKKGEHHGK